jgi:hypothetical protein
LANLAPEADLAGLDPKANLRTALDLDSFDFLRFLIGLGEAPRGRGAGRATTRSSAPWKSLAAYLKSARP